jgi:hypothetical protein
VGGKSEADVERLRADPRSTLNHNPLGDGWGTRVASSMKKKKKSRDKEMDESVSSRFGDDGIEV